MCSSGGLNFPGAGGQVRNQLSHEYQTIQYVDTDGRYKEAASTCVRRL